jgi:hypothetical protein
MAYDIINTINASNTKTLADTFSVVSVASEGWFGGLILSIVFLGYLLLFSKEQKIDDLLASSFVTVIIGSLLFFANIVTWPILIAFITLFLLIFVLKWWLL